LEYFKGEAPARLVRSLGYTWILYNTTEQAGRSRKEQEEDRSTALKKGSSKREKGRYGIDQTEGHIGEARDEAAGLIDDVITMGTP
jgi:hypothetical protein